MTQPWGSQDNEEDDVGAHPDVRTSGGGGGTGASPLPSPRVQHVAWARMEVDGWPAGKDFKLYPGGGRDWDWAETGTTHYPGIQPADVQELLDHGATIVVLSRGMHLRLQIAEETLALLAARGVSVHVAETKKAVAIYNRLAATEAVGGLFHSTC